MQQSLSLYIGQEKYNGIFRGRPNIPPGELWVFWQHNGEAIAVTREDENFKPPRAPFFERYATIIYKLRRKASYDRSQQYLSTSAFPTTITWRITLEIREAIKFINTGQYECDNYAEVDAGIIAALQPHVEEMLRGRLNPQIVINPHDLTVPAIESLLPERRFDRLVRNLRELSDIGLAAQLVAVDIRCPAYEDLLGRATLQPQQALLDGQRMLISAAIEAEILGQRRKADNEYITTEDAYVKQVLPQISAILQTLTGQASSVDPQTASDIVKRVMGALPQSPQQQAATLQGSGPAAALSSSNVSSNQRLNHIEQLYQVAPQEQWILSPAPQQVKDSIRVDLGNGSFLDLFVPQDYPTNKARIDRAKRNGTRLSQSDVSQVTQAATSGSYDLVMLITAMVRQLQP